MCFGVREPELAAERFIERILVRLGGAHVYLPKRSSTKRATQREELLRRFNGSNLFEFAREFNMLPRHASVS